MNTKTTLTALTLTLGLALLTGCASTTSATPAAMTAAPAATAASSAPAPDATPTPTAPVEGAPLTADAAKTLPTGWNAYPMADGSLVAVADAQPIPAVVAADIAAPAIAAVAARGADSVSGITPVLNAISAAVGRLQSTTNRWGIGVFKVYTANGWVWLNTQSTRTHSSSHADALAAAKAFVASQAEPGRWDIIDAG